MIELIDEIGREHVKALRELREKELACEGMSQVGAICIVYEPSLITREDVLEGVADEKILTRQGKRLEPIFTLMDAGVHSYLHAHGLLAENPDRLGPGISSDRQGRIEVASTNDVVSARGREFLDRKVLSGCLSVFPAKCNKWIATVFGVVGVGMGAAEVFYRMAKAVFGG